LALVCAGVVAWAWPAQRLALALGAPWWAVSAALSAAAWAGAAGHREGERGWRALGSAAWVVWCAASMFGAPLAPLRGALVAMACVAGLAYVWPPERLRVWDARARSRPARGGGVEWIGPILSRPSRVLVVSFAALCVVGTLALELPGVAAGGGTIGWLDAAFTAVSAVCVTGLIVLDTPTALTGFGQAIVLALIQVGGLGIMVLSAAVLVLLGRRLSLSHERAAADLLGAKGRAGLVGSMRAILWVTVLTEASAAALLVPAFVAHGDGWGEAAWRAVFTSVSAFCNAGFALQSASLVPYAGSPWVLGVVGATIVVGGAGPAVVASRWLGGERVGVYVRLVVWTTAALIALPACAILALEWGGTLAGMSLVDKVANAVFQSVTLRTAGFNSIDLAAIHPATWTLMVGVMFVGGSPGSTAGGVKTTTAAVVVLAVAAVARGRERVEVWGREIATRTVLRAMAVVVVGVLSCGGALVAVQLTQELALDVAVFEVVSALATVGLSTGGTGALDEVGKLLIIGCMFAGRVGPLTLFVFLASRVSAGSSRRYPVEVVPVG
jgi:trk system potassium uptake protein TrkH